MSSSVSRFAEVAMHILAFVDLDDTLFQTRHKCPPGPLVPGAYGRDGTPLSFMSAPQQRFAAWLGDTALVVPTTGRDLAALRRVTLRWNTDPAIADPALINHAIINHGGSIVRNDDSPDPDWQAHIDTVLAATSGALQAVLTELREVSAGLGVRVRAIGDFGRTLYLVLKHPDADLGAVTAARQHAERLVGREDPDGLRVIANGNNVAVIPSAISKEAAVDYLLEHYRHLYGPVLSLGVGDSLSDTGFLSRCDFAVTPTRGQIWTEWVGDNIAENTYGFYQSGKPSTETWSDDRD
ncbi:MAG: hypothetical protein U5L04_17480 [Trueperaceae bacterium]|nr:hypothetical protein [Trueperaceae bacterium]